jgi:Uma2 family endonuclease
MDPDTHFAPEVDITDIRTEDDTPVDNFFSEKQQRLLTEPLYSSWSGPGEGRPFIAAANVGLFSSPKKPPLVPDVFLSLDAEVAKDIWAKSNRTYFVWEFGKAPEVVIEVVSNREGGEATTKLAAYRTIGIPFYVIFDPQELLSDRVLRVYELAGAFYREMSDARFAAVRLGLVLWKGLFEDQEATWLRWCDENGEIIRTGGERADAERARADAERARAERLVERLKALGVDSAE